MLFLFRPCDSRTAACLLPKGALSKSQTWPARPVNLSIYTAKSKNVSLVLHWSLVIGRLGLWNNAMIYLSDHCFQCASPHAHLK